MAKPNRKIKVPITKTDLVHLAQASLDCFEKVGQPRFEKRQQQVTKTTPSARGVGQKTIPRSPHNEKGVCNAVFDYLTGK